MTYLETLLSSVFRGGAVCCRELRLTPQEAAYILLHYPARLNPMGDGWYEMNFKVA